MGIGHIDVSPPPIDLSFYDGVGSIPHTNLIENFSAYIC